eukprot:515532-Pyramimonas_sp.AAC.1
MPRMSGMVAIADRVPDNARPWTMPPVVAKGWAVGVEAAEMRERRRRAAWRNADGTLIVSKVSSECFRERLGT